MDYWDILDLFFTRSEQAIVELDAKYGAIFHALAYNILASREDADECVNDAYLGAWNAIPPERPERLSAWVCRVVRNAALSRRRRDNAIKRGGNYTLALEELEGVLPAPGNVGDELEAKELTREIECFLDTLSEENRVIFLRRYWFSDSLRDIARRTGLSEKAVNVRLTRLRRQLKKYLAEQEVYV